MREGGGGGGGWWVEDDGGVGLWRRVVVWVIVLACCLLVGWGDWIALEQGFRFGKGVPACSSFGRVHYAAMVDFYVNYRILIRVVCAVVAWHDWLWRLEGSTVCPYE